MFELWKRSLLSIFNCFWKRSPACAVFLGWQNHKLQSAALNATLSEAAAGPIHILAPGHELGSRFVRLTGQKTNKIQKHTMPVDTRMPVMLKHNNLCFYASTKYKLYILQIVAQSMIWSNNLLYPIWLWSHGWKGVFTVLLEPWEISPRMTWDSWGRDVLRWLRRGGKALRTWWLAA